MQIKRREIINKRADTLLKFVIDLLIGAICVVILFFLFSSIMNIFFHSEEKEKAQETLNRLAQSLIITEEDSSTNFLFTVPKSWWFVSISKSITPNEPKIVSYDKKCITSDCICICRKGLVGLDCNKNAVCLIVSRPFTDIDNQLVSFEIKILSMKITKKKEAYVMEHLKEVSSQLAIPITITTHMFESLSEQDKQNFNDGYNNMVSKGYDKIIESVVTQYYPNLEADIVKAVMIKENVPMNHLITTGSSTGLMQIKPDTAKIVFSDATEDKLKEPEYNIHAGAGYLAYMLNKYFAGSIDDEKNLELLFLGYHDGEGVINKCNQYPSPSSNCDRDTWRISDAAKEESINYAPVVIAYYQQLKLMNPPIQT
jgi:hypothetical protein